MEDRRLRNELQEGYHKLFSSFPSEIMITVHFYKLNINNETVYRILKELVRKIAKSKKTQVAGFAIYNYLRSPHAHLLIFGKTSSIKNLSLQELNNFLKFGSNHIREVEDKGAAFYLALNTTPNQPEKFELFVFNMRVLKKYRQRCEPLEKYSNISKL